MSRSFGVDFTEAEIASLIGKLKGIVPNRIDSAKFLYEFFKLKDEYDTKHIRHQFYLNEQRNKKLMEDSMVFAITSTSTSTRIHTAIIQDMESAFNKLKNAAAYTRKSIFLDFKKYFESGDLSPPDFHRFLDQHYEIYLTPGELDATVRAFDLNGDGLISYGEFMTSFHQLALEERARRMAEHQNWLKKQHYYKVIMGKKRERKFQAEIDSRILWPALIAEEDDDEVNVSVKSESTKEFIQRVRTPKENQLPRILTPPLKAPLKIISPPKDISFPRISKATKETVLRFYITNK